MNDLNDPPRWNIEPPDHRGRGAAAGDGNQWNYALLVPILGLAAFRWIWERDSQKELQKVKSQYEKEVTTMKSELEARYRETFTEQRRSLVQLEVQLEKEKQRVEGFKNAMLTQNQRLMQERKLLQEEQKLVAEEKQRVVKSGAAGAALRDALKQEDTWVQRAHATLKELEAQLVERQSAFCSPIQSRHQREEMERNMLLKVVREPIAREVDLESDLKDIFRRDKYCADYLNMDKRKNGSLMWVYLKYWQLQVTVQKHKRAEEALLTGTSHTK
ncbi:coiled-coil domain-containing protein 127a [Neosynchiropus ocellatus]